jgi:hypothetical protein
MNLSGIGNVIGGLGSAYGAYSQGKMAKELLKLQKMDWREEKDRKKKSQARLDLGASRAFGQKYDSAALPMAG